MELQRLIAAIEAHVSAPSQGLPQDIFLFLSKLTPMVNVDLLIANDHGETLLTWRDDEYYGPGWHIPGGIIRFKETAAARISQVAHLELGTQVLAAATPELVSEIMAQHRDTRGHFISLLYRCQLIAPPNEEMKYNGRKLTNGAWHWFGYCPENLIPAHNIYRPYIGTI